MDDFRSGVSQEFDYRVTGRQSPMRWPFLLRSQRSFGLDGCFMVCNSSSIANANAPDASSEKQKRDHCGSRFGQSFGMKRKVLEMGFSVSPACSSFT